MKRILIILCMLFVFIGCAPANKNVSDEVEKGDIVNIDFVGTYKGVAFEGGTSKGYDLRIGSHSFVDDFEEQLIGMKKGEKKTITVTFPSPYPNSPTLAGQDVQFEVTINEINR